jgi:3-methylcrotonyl-CoA carboxylase alpha subunit
VDSGVAEGDTVSPFYDPMLGKLIAWGENREEARLRLLAMLDETAVGGVRTNLAFLRRVVGHRAFAEAELDTGFIPRHERELLRPAGELSEAFWQQAAECFVRSAGARVRDDDAHSPWTRRDGLRFGLPAQISLHLQCNGESRRLKVDPTAQQSSARSPKAIRQGDTLYLQWQGEWLAINRFDPIAEAEASHQQHGGLTAPMNGSIVRVLVEAGQHVEAGTALIVLEAMKMEHSIRSAQAGVVKRLFCSEGEMVSEGAVLLEMEEA